MRGRPRAVEEISVRYRERSGSGNLETMSDFPRPREAIVERSMEIEKK